MALPTKDLVEEAARQLDSSEDDILAEGLRAFLEKELRNVKIEIFEIAQQYGVSSVEELEARYRDGTVEEATSWRDLQRLDHLEYRRDQLEALLARVE